jgi:ribose transport system permease protein
MAIFVAVGAIALSKTRFVGRCWPRAAMAGGRVHRINTKRIKFEVLLISGTAAFAGMLYAGRCSRAIPMGTRRRAVGHRSRHPGWHQSFGGAGSVIGTLFGALLIGLINNGLILAGLDASQQQVIRGAIIILAVALARKK